MSDEQKTAYVLAQIEFMRAEAEGMKAENRQRERRGYAPAYGESAWDDFQKKWEPILGSNTLLALFHDIPLTQEAK